MKVAVIGSRGLTVKNLENIFRPILRKLFREVQGVLTPAQESTLFPTE